MKTSLMENFGKFLDPLALTARRQKGDEASKTCLVSSIVFGVLTAGTIHGICALGSCLIGRCTSTESEPLLGPGPNSEAQDYNTSLPIVNSNATPHQCEHEKPKTFPGSSKMQIPHGYKDQIDLVLGTAPLRKAKIVLIGDTNHDDLELKTNIWHFIKNNAKEGDTVLLEGYRSLEPFETHGVLDKSIQVLGWDNGDLLDVLRGKVEVRGETLKKLKGVGNSSALGVELDKKIQRLHGEILHLAICKRNPKLLETIAEVLRQTSGSGTIFVVAGDAHYTNELILGLPADLLQNYNYSRFVRPLNPGPRSELLSIPNMHEGRPSTTLIKIRLPNGTLYALGKVWFKNPEQITKGGKVELDPSSAPSLLEALKDVPAGFQFEVVDVQSFT